MKKTRITSTLYIPIKQDRYLLDSKGNVRVYKSEENLKRYIKDYDDILVYELV